MMPKDIPENQKPTQPLRLGDSVPDEVLAYLHAYGDSRADEDDMSRLLDSRCSAKPVPHRTGIQSEVDGCSAIRPGIGWGSTNTGGILLLPTGF